MSEQQQLAASAEGVADPATRKAAPREYPVGAEADFPPGSHKVVKAGTQDVGVFNVDGTLHALINVCPHQYGPACAGPVGGEMVCNAETGWRFHWQRGGEIVTCPWHGLEFDIITGQCLAPKEYRLRKCAVRVVDGEVRVSFSRAAA